MTEGQAGDVRARVTQHYRDQAAGKQPQPPADAPADAAADAPADAPPPDALRQFRAEIDKAEQRGAKILDHLRGQIHDFGVRFDHIGQVARNGASILTELADACSMPVDVHEEDDQADTGDGLGTRHSKARHRADEKSAQAVADAAAADDGLGAAPPACPESQSSRDEPPDADEPP